MHNGYVPCQFQPLTRTHPAHTSVCIPPPTPHLIATLQMGLLSLLQSDFKGFPRNVVIYVLK